MNEPHPNHAELNHLKERFLKEEISAEEYSIEKKKFEEIAHKKEEEEEEEREKEFEPIVEKSEEKIKINRSIKVLTIVISLALLLSVASLAEVVILSKQKAVAPTAPAARPTQPTNNPSAGNEKVDVSDDGDPSLGDKNAPVTIISFADFQCPYCGRFATQTFPDIKKNYIDTGKVKFVFRDFPLPFHQFAQKAHEAAECANEQGKFWEMHDLLFANQNALAINNLKQYAKDLGLDQTKFDSCLNSGKFAAEVAKDASAGQAAGVSGTPSFVINGQLLVGAQPFSAFQQIIEGELSK